MSIRTVLSTEQNEGDGNMTVGTSIEISSAVTSPTGDSLKSENCFALPYQDHDYGAATINSYITFQEKDEYNPFHHDKAIELSATSHLPHGPEKINGFMDIDSNSCQSATTDYSDLNDDVTRCICGFEHDDGYMICCDKCCVWQHIDCMQINRSAIPETYLCEKCEPRSVNQEYAIKLQTTKREDFLAHDSESGTEDEKGREINGVTYTAVQCTPTSMTITSNRHKKSGHHTGKRRKRSADSHLTNKRGVRDGRKRPQARFRSKSLLSTANDIDSTWLEEIRKWKHSYSNQDTNDYTETLKAAVNNIENTDSEDDQILLQLTAQLKRVQQLKDALLAMENIAAGQPVVEYIGSFMLTKSFETGGNDVKKRPYPYVLFYDGLDEMGICVDSRSYGNISRFVRRSCSPNAEIQHVINSGELRLFITCRKDVAKDTEITIPFDFKYEQCSYPVSCCCTNTKTCPVNVSTRRKYFNSSRGGRASFSSINGLINGYASSDDIGDDDFHQHKKSREERKMESYIRAFKELEKKEKKKELLQQHIHEARQTIISTPSLVPAPISPLPISITPPAVTTSAQSESIFIETSTVVWTAPATTTTSVITTSFEEPVMMTSVFPPTSVVTTPIAAKCNARRRSNRVRKVSRKLQTAINDENIFNKMLSNDPINDLPPSGIFLQPSSLIEPSSNSTVVSMPIAEVSVTGADLSTSGSVVTQQTCIVTLEEIPQNTIDNSKYMESDIKDDELDSMATSEWNCNQETASDNDLETQTSPTTWQTHNIAITNNETNRISIKLVKSTSRLKRPSSTVDWISGRSMSPILTGRPRSVSICNPTTTECGISSSVLSKSPQVEAETKLVIAEPQLPVLNCNVIPWDFRPGVPNGMVRINVCSCTRSRPCSYVKSNIKKRWLKQIEEDELAKTCEESKTDCLSGESKETRLKFLPFKKRKLFEIQEEEIEEPNSIPKSIKIDENIAVLSSEDIQNALGTTAQDHSVESDSLPNLHKLDIPDLLMDEKPTTPELSVVEDSNLPQTDSASNNLPLHDEDVLCDILPISLLNQDSLEQQPAAAAVKKKVSLQEYLKRSKPKESKKEGTVSKPKSSVVPISEVITEEEDEEEIKPATDCNSTKENDAEKTSDRSQETSFDKETDRTNDAVQPKTAKENQKEIHIEKIEPVVTVSKNHNQVVDKITHSSEAKKVADEKKLATHNQIKTYSISKSPILLSNTVTKNSDFKPEKTLMITHRKSSNSFINPSGGESSSASSTPREHVIVSKSHQDNHLDNTPIHSPLPQQLSYTRSRHNSSASSNSSKSPIITQDHIPMKTHIKSPKGMPIPRSLGRRINSGKPWHEPSNFRRKSPPRKVPSLTPAVPGQPIPSLMRTGDGRGPQRIFNRESPRRDRSPSPDHWRHHPPNSYPDLKYPTPQSPNSQWRRPEYGYRRENYSPGPPPGYQPPPPRPYFHQNSSDHQSIDNRPYSPKQYYRHEGNSSYHVPYNDHPPPFRKQHSSRYSPNDYSSSDPHYDYSYHYS